MSESSYSLQQIKKEIQHLGNAQMADLCIRLARYKKENKELLAYLLFEAHDEQTYTDKAKQESHALFNQLPSHAYHTAKALRKIIKLNHKHSKFSGSKIIELELLIDFCDQYLEHVDRRASYKPLRTIFVRQLQKTITVLKKLPEDLQFDYQDNLNSLLTAAGQQLSWFNKNNF